MLIEANSAIEKNFIPIHIGRPDDDIYKSEDDIGEGFLILERDLYKDINRPKYSFDIYISEGIEILSICPSTKSLVNCFSTIQSADISPLPFLELEICKKALGKDIQISFPDKNVFYSQPEEAKEFLSANPSIELFINNCWSDLLNFFGQSVCVKLDVMKHYGENPHKELIGWIQSNDEIEEGLDKLDLFYEKWLSDQIKMCDNKFNFNIEFIDDV